MTTTTNDRRMAQLLEEYRIPEGTSPNHRQRGEIRELAAAALIDAHDPGLLLRRISDEAHELFPDRARKHNVEPCECGEPAWLHRVRGACMKMLSDGEPCGCGGYVAASWETRQRVGVPAFARAAMV